MGEVTRIRRGTLFELAPQRIKAIRTEGVRKMAFSSDTTRLVREAVAAGVPFPEELKQWLGRLDDGAAAKVVKAMISAAGEPVEGLSEREIAKCKARGVDPAKYAANKARMTGGK